MPANYAQTVTDEEFLEFIDYVRKNPLDRPKVNSEMTSVPRDWDNGKLADSKFLKLTDCAYQSSSQSSRPHPPAQEYALFAKNSWTVRISMLLQGFSTSKSSSPVTIHSA